MVDLVPPGDDPDELLFRADCTPYGAEVVDLDGVRVRFGVRKARGTACQHRHLMYSPNESRVWCEDCKRTIENFDAFMALVKGFQNMERAARSKLDAARKAEAATINRKVAKEIDRAWGGRAMAISCPHCNVCLLPEDFTAGGMVQRSREMEIARRKRQGGG